MCQDSSMVRFLRIDPMVNDSSPASLSGKILVHWSYGQWFESHLS